MMSSSEDGGASPDGAAGPELPPSFSPAPFPPALLPPAPFPPAPSPPVSMPKAARVGADLRAARERLGWTLPAIAAHLRIRLPFLEAIEDGRIGDLPGNAYAVGFVRTYAQSLGLDPDEIARRFRAEAADINRKTELAFPAPVPERGVPAGAVVLLGAILVIGAYAGWYRMTGNARPGSEAVLSVPPRLEPMIQAARPAPLLVTPSSPQAAASHVVPPPGPALSPASAAAAMPVPAIAPAPPAPAVLAADGGRIVLRARSDAWMQVRDKAGPVVLNRVMRGGETWPVPGKGQFLLTTGNAGGTELLVDGVVAPPLGSDGTVRRDMPLDADQIRDGKLAGAAPSTKAPAARSQ